jgi:DNA modification methylase
MKKSVTKTRKGKIVYEKTQTGSVLNEPLFVYNKTLIINKSKLLEVLLKLKAEESLLSLRNKLLELRHQLTYIKSDTIGLLNIDSINGDTIKLNQDYLLKEVNQISESQTIERAKYYVERFTKGISEIKTNKINDINLNRWKEYDDIHTDSLWILDKRDSSGVHTAGYWGNFIPQIPNQMLRRYTKKNEWVLDTFVGSGTTLIESQRLGRNGIGIELQENVAEKAKKLITSEQNKFNTTNEIIVGDSASLDFKNVIHQFGKKSVQMVIMHPPYFDIIKFSNDSRDLSNASSVDSFILLMNKVVENATSVLDKGRYLVVVIGDKYSKGDWIPLGFLVMNEIMKKNFSLKSVIIKNFEETAGKRNQKELWRYRALVGGFYIFKHEYILLFKKK